MSHASTYEPKTAFTRWLDSRLPIIRWTADFMVFPTPRNLNYIWTFGAILTFFLVLQIITGVIVAMHYTPNTALAFDSIERLDARRELWLADSLHAHGRRVAVLPGRLYPPLPRPLLRVLQGSARGALDDRRRHPHRDDCDGVHGIFAGLGPNELLGRDGDHEPLLLI